jgi:DNA-binding transcriptional regulator LsrR (DeoR family)
MSQRTRDPRYDGAKRTEAARLYRAGLSERAVAEKMGLSRARVQDLLDEKGVKRRRVGRPRERDRVAL